MSKGYIRLRRQRLGDRRQQGPVGNVPDVDRKAKRWSTASECAGPHLRQDVQSVHTGTHSPRQCGTETTLLPIVQQNPSHIAIDSRRPEREVHGLQTAPCTVVASQCGELDSQKTSPARFVGHR
jgi:hypothetical protein